MCSPWMMGKLDTRACRSLFVPRITVFASVFVLHRNDNRGSDDDDGGGGAPLPSNNGPLVHARFHTHDISNSNSNSSRRRVALTAAAV